MVYVEFRWERHSADWWTEENPMLGPGEPAVELGTGWFKLGPGYWNDLPYYKPSGISSDQDLLDHINSLLPHPVYDDGPSLELLYENVKAG